MAYKINDFGEKIGGARKDAWKKCGLSDEDLKGMNEAEREKYTTRDSVWPLPDAKAEIADGLPVFVAYWKRKVRLMVAKTPFTARGYTVDESRVRYIHAVQELRELVEKVRSEDDFEAFYKAILSRRTSGYYPGFTGCWYGNIKSDLARLRYRHGSMKLKMQRSGFPGHSATSARKRKTAFIPPQLEHIERGGEDYRHGRHMRERDWIPEFGFRGVQFGNYMSQKDRQASMDFAYDALKDLAYALGIGSHSLTFDGKLALAFGARGHGNGRAHYETDREVINLTKMAGAGCLAHEWMHALDHRLAIVYGGKGLASGSIDDVPYPESFRTLVRSLKRDADGNATDFLRGSRTFDRHFAKEAYGGWTSNAEMLARAFACYVKDTLGYKSDYLIAHADAYVFEYDNMGHSAVPQGEEREIFNELFDILFADLKEEGILHVPEIREKPDLTAGLTAIVFPLDSIVEQADGQYALAF